MCLESQHKQRRESLETFLQRSSALPPIKRLLSIFNWIESHQRGDWARGCPFVNASVELTDQDATARDAVRHHKRWFRQVLTQLADEAGAVHPAAIASQLHLLIEGANARMLAEADLNAIADARRAAAVLLINSCGTKKRSSRARG